MNMNDYKLVSAKDCKVTKVDGLEDQYVYDMEVSGGSHTFFANGILLHNSIYVRMDNILKLLFKTTDVDWDDPVVFHKIKSFVDDKFQKILNTHVADFICEHFYTPERRIEFKREKISSEGNYLSKKHYVVHVRDNEDVECDKFSYTGVDIAKNELPQTLKDMMQELVENMMKNHWTGSEVLNQEIEKIKTSFKSLGKNDIGFIKNLATPKRATAFLHFEKGAGVHARAAEMYNQLIVRMGIDNKYEKINQGDRFHYIYVIPENKYNIDCIAWKDRWPTEFDDIFKPDIELMFMKTIIAPLKRFLENHDAVYTPTNSTMIVNEDGKSIFDL